MGYLSSGSGGFEFIGGRWASLSKGGADEECFDLAQHERNGERGGGALRARRSPSFSLGSVHPEFIEGLLK